MNLLPTCLLHTQDLELGQRVTGFLSSIADIHHVESLEKLQGILERDSHNVVLIDIRSQEVNELLPALPQTWPGCVPIVLGTPGSDPLLRAQALGVYATEDLQANRQRLEGLISQALDHLQLRQENRILREEAAQVTALKSALFSQPTHEAPSPIQPSRHFPGALRHFDNVEGLLQNLVEGVAGSMLISRVGIFCRTRDSQTYRLRGSLRCLEDTAQMEYSEKGAVVQWLKRNTHIVSRDNLEHVKDTTARTLLQKTLDILGAEVLIPLQIKERLLGWIFAGHRTTGLPFGHAELESLALVAEHVSTTLENALLYEEVAIQKTLGDTLLHSMPSGIVAVDEDGVVRWFNNAAETIFDATPADVIGQDIEELGSRISTLVHDALAGDTIEQPEEWVDPRTKRTLLFQTRRLEDNELCLGAVVLIQDITVERMLEEKQEQLERAAFWTELAAAMSHEIRNPLVAIKTFSQLLPERYEEEDFRAEFSQTVVSEVDRLNSIIDQINDFAHPHDLELRQLDIRQAIKGGLDLALSAKSSKGVWVDTSIDEKLPLVDGDQEALATCFTHLIQNAMEALATHEGPRIVLTAKEYRDGEIPSGVAISIQDNAGGIKDDIRSKVFSPFCTTKARGMGLGLPIVKRTVIDHGGRVHIESTEKGTCVTILLPSNYHGEEDETHSDSGRRARKS